jgi:hypothetical protein
VSAVVLTAALVMPIVGHTVSELEAWETDWDHRAVDFLDERLMVEWRSMVDRHSWYFSPDQVAIGAAVRVESTPRLPARPVEEWRPLVAQFFPIDLVDLALLVISCESGGDPGATNPYSGAAGLFQHMPRYWSQRSSDAGWPAADIYDPSANVAVAAWLVATDGWRHWNPSRGCWS